MVFGRSILLSLTVSQVLERPLLFPLTKKFITAHMSRSICWCSVLYFFLLHVLKQGPRRGFLFGHGFGGKLPDRYPPVTPLRIPQ